MILRLKVQPRARRNQLGGKLGAEWKLQLLAPPVEGRANQACIDFLARGLGIARSRVRLLSGQRSPHKVFELEGVAEEDFLKFAAGKSG